MLTFAEHPGRLLVLLMTAIQCAVPTRAAEHEHPAPEKLGTVHFPSSCSGEAQKNFERGVALLHSFAYSAAEESFKKASKTTCAMPHWGVAMSYFHQLWEPIPSERIGAGLAQLEEAKKLAGSDRERRLIDALNVVYTNADSIGYKERVSRYTQAMEQVARHYPDDVESQIFYALALLATASPSDRTHAKQKQAVAILEPLFKQYPEHPGIAHYLIHACDNAEMAQRGLTAAEAYSQIAPSAPHALHMPSHIYTRLGMWQKSVTSNLAAQKAAREQGDKGEELHAMDYLVYASLQLGDDVEAAHVLDQLRAMSELNHSDFKVGYAASAMPVRYAMERRQWADAAQLVPFDDAPPHVLAITLWARSVGSARSGKPIAARREIEKLKDAHERLRAAADEYWASQVHVQINEALAWVAEAEGKSDEAVKLMRKAADEEDATEKLPVTPGSIIPAREQLADLLLDIGDAREALTQYNAALAQAPQRRGAVLGASRAEAAQQK